MSGRAHVSLWRRLGRSEKATPTGRKVGELPFTGRAELVRMQAESLWKPILQKMMDDSIHEEKFSQALLELTLQWGYHFNRSLGHAILNRDCGYCPDGYSTCHKRPNNEDAQNECDDKPLKRSTN
jgi:hypothetical protein